MKFPTKKFLVSLFLIAVILTSFGSGVFVGKSQVKCKSCPPEDLDFSLFWESYHALQEKFVDKSKLDYQRIIDGAISGMVKSLGDPYTVFFTPEESKRFQEDVSGVFEGVGMEIGQRKGRLTIIAPLEGTPAQKAGFRSGDVILKIGDKPTDDLTVDEAVSLIRGPKGTEVVLTVLRDEWETPKEIKVTRDVITVPTLKVEIKEDDIAYVKLYHFDAIAANEFERAMREILNGSTKKIILDLRDNPGGYLDVAQDIASWFLERGQIITIEDFGGAKENEEYKSNMNGPFRNYPIVILINQGSASASEILAGALRDNRGVKLIGEKSFGKGSVQELNDLTGGSSLKITIANWLTPKGNLISDVGLEPDIKVEMTEKDYEEGRDPQLDKAIEIIKGL